jgi:hypothetical protein
MKRNPLKDQEPHIAPEVAASASPDPILRIDCDYKGKTGATATADRANELMCRVTQGVLGKDWKVLLTSNLWISRGLVNVSTDTVVDFVYDPNGPGAPKLRQAVIVNFPDYTGPSFFQDEGHEKCVPVPA